MKNVLVIDNYDSFTFNLVHYLEELNCKVTVLRNDAFEIDEIATFDAIVLSPGPGVPEEAGLLKTLITTYYTSKKILGICLGQQAIAEVFGGSLINLDTVYHGVATTIKITVPDEHLFQNLPNEFEVGRYHSWAVDPKDFPDCLEITSIAPKGEIMSLRHRNYNVKAVQFHPESILTPYGKIILKNWVET